MHDEYGVDVLWMRAYDSVTNRYKAFVTRFGYDDPRLEKSSSRLTDWRSSRALSTARMRPVPAANR